MNLDRMLFRLYVKPVLIFFLSLGALFFFGYFVPNTLSSTLFAGLGDSSKIFAPKAFIALLIIGAMWFLWSSINLWKWYQGYSNEFCHNCGGMTTYHQGIRGRSNYYKCMACGVNRANR